MKNTVNPINCPPSGYAIGIDVGGTKIAGGLVDLAAGGVLSRQQVVTRPERGGEALLAEVEGMAAALIDTGRGIGVAIRGIGIGVAELVDPSGAITSGHAIPWCGVPVAERLAHLAPTVVEADVRAHALAEARYGAGKMFRQFVFVTIGTGISSCLVLDGRPHAGARGNALVLASSAVTTTCPVCGDVTTRVLEEFAGGPGLVARWNVASGSGATRAEEVLAAAARGDNAAVEVVVSAGEALGATIGWLIDVLDPEAVVIGGGLGTAGGLYWERLVTTARRQIWADTSRDLPILPAALGPDAGLVGAAAKLLMPDA